MIAGTVTSAAVAGLPVWDVVVGDRFIAAVLAPSPDACTSALAVASADDRVSIESLVGMIPLGGADAVDSFAIVWWPGTDTSEVTAVVGGDAVVDLSSPGGTRRFDARGIRPWHLADFGAVVALRVTGADAPLGRLGEAAEPVGRSRAGLRASAVEWSASAPQPQRPDASVADADTVLVPRAHYDDDDATADTIRTPQRTTSSRANPPHPSAALGSPPSTSPLRTIARGLPTSPPGDHDLAGRRPRVIGAGLRLDADGVHAGTVLAVASPSPVAPASAPAAESAPAAASAIVPPSTSAPPDVPAFRIGDGERHPVTGPVLIGRRPLAPRIPDPGGASPELVAVASPRALVSGTHLELRIEGSRLVATDLKSTNGTIVRSASGSRRMRAGESIVVAPGTRLDLGDDTIIEILPTPAAPLE